MPAIRGSVTGFSQRSGIDVKLDLHQRSSHPVTLVVSLGVEDSQVHLKVIDHGRGFPSQTFAARQEDSSIGIGLPGMRERTRQLGGKMEIDSSGEETAIHVTLPLGEAA